MIPSRCNLAAVSLLTFAALLGAQNVLPPGTGAGQYFDPPSGKTFDTNWYIIADTMKDEPQDPYYSTGVIVNPVAGGWAAALTGTTWIAPAADQTNGTRPGTCCLGSTTYELPFPIANAATAALTISLYADDTATVMLNGVTIYTGTGALYSSGIKLAVTTGFVSGNNKLDIVVSNATGGPTGLDVSFAAVTTIAPATLGSSAAPSTYSLQALPDPVDSGSGQFYETSSDMELGGPMNLGFRRSYSSQLSNGKVSTALGTNWMSNFDARSVVSGTNAQVLLFGGTIVSFASSGGVWQLVAPKDVAYQFIPSGANYQFLDPIRSRIYTFSSAGVLTSIADRNGNAVTITQGANGPTAVSDGMGRTLTFTYANNQLTEVTDQAARTVSFAYSGGLLASATDIYKQTTLYSYTTAGSAAGLMTHKQLPLGNIPASQTYDSQSRVLTQRIVPGNNGNAYTTTIAYDGNGGTTITDGLGNVTKHGNSAVGNIEQISDPAGGTATVTYDSSNRRTSITDKVGNRTSYAYDPQSGLLSSMTDALGNTTTLNYQAQVQAGFTFYSLLGISYPDGTSVSRTYDPNGNVLSETGQKGTVTKYAYNASGLPSSITGVNQQSSTYTWNPDGTMASTTDALGNTRTFAYDSTKRMTSTVNPNGGTTGYVRDKSTTGPMLAIIPPVTGESTTIDGDQNDELARVVISTGGVYTSTYTATGQLSTFADPLNDTKTYAYDGDNRVSSITNPAGDALLYAYDSANRITSLSDVNGPRKSYTYTAESKIATATDGSGKTASYSYDQIGRLATITTPSGSTYKIGYDKLGNLISRTNPLGEIEALTRDAAGAVVAGTRPGAVTTSMIRDASGKVTSLTTPNGNIWKTTYDAIERPLKRTDPLGNSTAFSFTGTRLTGATLPLGTLTITNDADGRITQKKFSDGTAINKAYDVNGMLISSDGVTITRDAAGRPVNINGIGTALDANSRPATLTYAAGKTVTYAYDTSGRLASITDWTGGKTTVVNDGGGRIASLTYPNGVKTTYGYDADGRLITIAAGSLSSITLTRDAAGKVTSATRTLPRTPALAAASQQFSYDASGQLASATSDTMGRVTAQSGRKYTWNLASQLTSFADSVNTGTFTYDGLGEMSSSTASGAAQTFVFNYLLHYPALSIVRQGGADLRYYVYLPNGTLLYSIEAADNTAHYYHFDEMGNTMFLTDKSGAMTDSYAVTPYGENTGHIGTFPNPFTWQGQYGVIEEGTGLFYVRSRHYDASAARFVSRDPRLTNDPRAAEPYTYAGGNPMMFIDPMGTDITLPGASPLSPATHKPMLRISSCA